MTVESLLGLYGPAPEPTEAGYATDVNANIHGYAYETARTVVAYLRDAAAHPHLEWVTAAGSAEFVPPSYYFMPRGHSTAYDDWIASDHYYASPDYDWVDNYGVMRISVQSADELAEYAVKVQRWTDALDPSWTNNASLAGGNPFHSYYYIGEMMNNQMLCADLFNGYRVDRFQLHRSNFTHEALTAHLRDDDFLLHFHVSHGSGGAMSFDDHTLLTAARESGWTASWETGARGNCSAGIRRGRSGGPLST